MLITAIKIVRQSVLTPIWIQTETIIATKQHLLHLKKLKFTELRSFNQRIQ
jgi:hypothetical protein